MNKSLEQAFKAKEEYRKTQAARPTEEKINKLGALQQRYTEIKSKTAVAFSVSRPQKKLS